MQHFALKHTTLCCIFLLFVLSSCHRKDDSVASPTVSRVDAPQIKKVKAGNYSAISEGREGMLGLFDVPEMISICKLDSAAPEDVSNHIKTNFELLEKELIKTRAEVDKSQGMIYYVSAPGNLKFECFILLKKIPQIAPKNAQIVVLEASNMLIFDCFGSAEEIQSAYEEIKLYCNKNNLVQNGPMRELYPVNSADSESSASWYTRIMVPVVQKSSN